MKYFLLRLLIFIFIFCFYTKANANTSSFLNGVNFNKNYQAIVQGKITKKKVKKVGNTYITEYKLKTKKWLFKNPQIKKTKYITIKVLGAELPNKGIVIKASTTPNYIPIKEEAIFLLQENKLKQENVFTLSKGGVIYEKL